jgi:hypothetical protein
MCATNVVATLAIAITVAGITVAGIMVAATTIRCSGDRRARARPLWCRGRGGGSPILLRGARLLRAIWLLWLPALLGPLLSLKATGGVDI